MRVRREVRGREQGRKEGTKGRREEGERKEGGIGGQEVGLHPMRSKTTCTYTFFFFSKFSYFALPHYCSDKVLP